jgi:hypothetical protein
MVSWEVVVKQAFLNNMCSEMDLTILETKSSNHIDRACEYVCYVSKIRSLSNYATNAGCLSTRLRDVTSKPVHSQYGDRPDLIY